MINAKRREVACQQAAKTLREIGQSSGGATKRRCRVGVWIVPAEDVERYRVQQACGNAIEATCTG